MDTEELIGKLAHEPSPVVRASHPFLLSFKWIAAAGGYITLSLAYSGTRPDLLVKLQSPWFLAEIGLLALIVLSASLSASLLAYPDVYQKRRMAYAPLVMLVLFAGVILLAWHVDTPPAPRPVHNVECTMFIALLSLLPAMWMFYSLRKFATTHPYLSGSIALLAAFGIGALSLRLSEHTDSIMHVMQWHYLPMLGVAMLGLWLGKLLLKW